ncbi:beta-ketoacyl synthase N-terminal-like domain-containing protein, partial [Escherichia coli]|uniref:beta-ketoacyl synthase N-terminal-like domain-containing protein n=1 Tax=Escherichia coli TaxID=562 RepID=UPI0024C4B2BE
SISSACTTGTHSIGDSFLMIQSGRIDVAVRGGSECPISPLGLMGFAATRALSLRNDAPESASRPWDVDRNGFVIGEGAG